MARYDWFILRIWRSGRRAGEQWAARLEQMPGGQSLRFTEPGDLLSYLAATIDPAADTHDAAESPANRGEAGD